MNEGGVIDQVPRLAFAVRWGNRAAMVVSDLGQRRRDGLTRFAAAAVAEWAVLNIARDRSPDQFWRRLVLAVSDCAIWAGSGDDDPDSTRWIMMSSAVALGLEAGFRSRLEVSDDQRSTRRALVPGRGRAVRSADQAIRLLAPTLGPTVAMGVGQRRHGRGFHAGQWLGFGAFATAGGFAVGHRLQQLRRAARREWRSREVDALDRYRAIGRADAARMTSDAHGFKKCLLWLATQGSAPARALLDEQLRWPRSRVTAPGGQTLGLGLVGVEIAPAEARTIWLPAEMLDELEAFIDEAEARPVDDDRVLRVGRWDGRHLDVSIWGHHAGYPMPMPQLEQSLDPLTGVAFVSAVWKLASGVPEMGGAPLRLVLPAAGIDLALGRRSALRRHGALVPDGAAVAGMVVTSVILAVGTAFSGTRTRTAMGMPVFTQTGQLQGAITVLTYYWPVLGRSRWALAVLLAAVWFGCALRPGDRTGSELVAEVLSQAAFATGVRGLSQRVSEEATLLERELQQGFDRRIEQGRREAWAEEIAHYRHQLEVAEAEHRRLGDGVDPELHEWFRRSCGEVDRWLQRQTLS